MGHDHYLLVVPALLSDTGARAANSCLRTLGVAQHRRGVAAGEELDQLDRVHLGVEQRDQFLGWCNSIGSMPPKICMLSPAGTTRARKKLQCGII